jgi:hypothetical protein
MLRSGSFSRDRRYRYRLGRRWGSGPVLPWFMLNPSTADDEVDDPTTRRVVAFSQSWGYGGCAVVNLFGFRCADPTALLAVDDPIGRANTAAVRAVIDDSASSGADRVVVAWGVQGQRHLIDPTDVGRRTRRLVAGASERWSNGSLWPVTLGTTATGAPRHPLYVPSEARPEPLPTASITATS